MKKPQRRNAAKPKKPTRPAGSAKNDEPAFSAPKGGNADSAARSADTRPEPDAPHGPGSGRRHIRHTRTVCHHREAGREPNPKERLRRTDPTADHEPDANPSGPPVHDPHR